MKQSPHELQAIIGERVAKDWRAGRFSRFTQHVLEIATRERQPQTFDQEPVSISPSVERLRRHQKHPKMLQ